tara:strand:- start:178 stop:576 length:399 start_codon:yes stop_codon:yes gene_type:complete
MMDLDVIEENIGIWSLSFGSYSFDPVYIFHGGAAPPTLECFEADLNGEDADDAMIDKIDFGFTLPGDSVTNNSRAYAAALALICFNRFSPNGEHQEVIPDLLCDLRHLADRVGVDFNQALDSSDRHYAAEVG